MPFIGLSHMNDAKSAEYVYFSCMDYFRRETFRELCGGYWFIESGVSTLYFLLETVRERVGSE